MQECPEIFMVVMALVTSITYKTLYELRSCNTYEGTSDIHSLILGKNLTGIESF